MKTSRKIFLVALFVVLGAAAACDGIGKVRLALRLAKGARYEVSLKADQFVSQTVMGVAQDVRQAIATDYAVTVEDVDSKGNTTLGFIYERIAVRISSPLGGMEYDSAAPPADVPPGLSAYAAIIGKGFAITVTPDLKISRVTGIDELLASILEPFAALDEQTRQSVEKMLREEFGEDAIRQTVEQSFRIYPDGPVGVGEQWSRTMRLRAGFPMILETTYTLAARKDGLATLAVRGAIRSDPESPDLEIGPMKLRVDLNGAQTGTTQVDEKTGWTMHSEVAQEVTGEMKMAGMPDAPDDSVAPITLRGTIVLEVKKKE